MFPSFVTDVDIFIFPVYFRWQRCILLKNSIIQTIKMTMKMIEGLDLKLHSFLKIFSCKLQLGCCTNPCI